MEEESGELTEKQQEFLRIIELVKPSRFIDGILSWCGLGRRLKSWEKMLSDAQETIDFIDIGTTGIETLKITSKGVSIIEKGGSVEVPTV